MYILGQESITRRRYAAGARDTDGVWVRGTSSDDTILASVQPASADNIQRLPEGRRSSRARLIITTGELRCEDQGAQVSADRVLVDGTWWEVGHVERDRAVLPHYTAVVTALQEQDPG